MINLNNWAVTLPTAETIYPITYNEYIKNDGERLTLFVPVNGKTTENSSYPRTELREIIEGKKKSWSSSIGKHRFEAIISVDKFPKNKPEVCVFQIHDGDDDVLQVLVDPQNIRFHFNFIKFRVLSYSPGERFRVKCKVRKNMVSLQINFEDPSELIVQNDTLFFKTGNYLQSNEKTENDSTQTSKVSIWDLQVSHLF